MNQENMEESNGSVQNGHNPGNARLQNLTRTGMNAMTGGAWNKARNAPIVGSALKKTEEKAANKLGNTKLGQRINNHQRPNMGAPTAKTQGDSNNSKNDDVGSQKLKSSLASKKGRSLPWRKKKKQEENKESDSSTNEENSQENQESESDSPLALSAEQQRRIKIKILIKVAMFAVPAFFLFALFVILASILTQHVVVSAPVGAANSYGTEEFEALNNEGNEDYDKEIAFYEKLKKVSEENFINVKYINAILLYRFYQAEIADDSENLAIDYELMTSFVDRFVEVINNSNSTDYTIGGPVYNAIKESDAFREYYAELLTTQTADEILTKIFEFALEIEEFVAVDDTSITSDTGVTVNNSRLSINEYLSDSIYARTDSLVSSEKAKAYTVVYSTNVVANNKDLSVKVDTASASNDVCSVSKGCSYDANGNLVTGPGAQSSLNQIYYNGGYYYRRPLTESEQQSLNGDVNSVLGNVLVNSDGTYPELDPQKIDGFGDDDGDYKEILRKAYGDYKFKNVGEDSYATESNYGNKKVLTPVIFYDQKDYAKSQFCGIKNYTIGGSGCGVTAMAIVASTYENNRKYDPIYMNTEAKNRGMCGTGGTNRGFFAKEAAVMKYKYLGGWKGNKSLLDAVLKHLSLGHLVVVRIGSGHFTSGGHYMVLGGIDPETKKVYVYDPNNRSNKSYRKTGNGWYSFNDIIVKEAYNFYIIWKG